MASEILTSIEALVQAETLYGLEQRLSEGIKTAGDADAECAKNISKNMLHDWRSELNDPETIASFENAFHSVYGFICGLEMCGYLKGREYRAIMNEMMNMNRPYRIREASDND